jgi:hypothetical protein
VQTTPTNPRRRPRRPRSRDLAATIQPMKEAAARLKQRVGRFEIYEFLEAVYTIYSEWRRRKVARRSARMLADRLDIVRRKGVSPIRILIDATLPGAHFKQKSRWVRALEYVYSENVSPSKFRNFVRNRGGLAGCAGLAVNVSRKRRRPGGDWID